MRKKILFLYFVVISLFFFLDAVTSESYQSAYTYTKQGIKFVNAKQYQEAIKSLNIALKILKNDPEAVVAYMSRGQAFMGLKKYKKAVKDFTKAISIDSDNSLGLLATAYDSRGRVYYLLNEPKKAVEDFDKAIAIEPTFADAYSDRGVVYKQLNQYIEAINDFNKASTLATDANQKDIFSYNVAAAIVDGLEYYSKAIEKNPKDEIAYNNRAICYVNSGEVGKAIEDYTTAIELNPRYGRAYFNLALLYAGRKQKGDKEKATLNLQKAIALDPALENEMKQRNAVLWEYLDREYLNSAKSTTDYEFAIFPKFEFAGYFSEGLAIAELGGKRGYINKQGNFVISPKYSVFAIGGYFSEGLAPVSLEGIYGPYQYIDKKGNTRINIGIGGATEFSEGLAFVITDDPHRLGYIDKNGRFVIDCEGVSGGFYEGLAWIFLGDKYGYINKKGEIAIKPVYKEAGNFSEGLAAVEVENRWGYINKQGRLVIEPAFDYAKKFKEGLAAVKIKDKWGYIDKAGNIVIKPVYDKAGSFSEGLAGVKLGDKWGYIDKNNNFVIQPAFDEILQFSNGLAPVRVKDKWGYIQKIRSL